MGTEENAIIAPAGTEESAPSTETPGGTPAPAEELVAPATTKETTATEEPVAAPVKEPSAAEKRIAKLVAQREDEKRNADYWRGVAEGRREVPRPPAPETVTSPQGPPKVENYEIYDDYLVAKAKYELRQEMRQEKENEAKAKVETTEKVAHQTFMERMEKAAETDPELLEDFKDPTLPISSAMASAIRESDAAPKVVRYLVDNRKEAARIAKLGPLAAARELGRIEEKVTAPPPKAEKTKTVSQAPEPIKTIDTKGKTVTDLETLPIDEFVKRRNAQQFGRKG